MKKIRLKIEDRKYGDQILEQPVEKAVETTKEQLLFKKFGVTDKNEVIDAETPKEEVEEKVKESEEISFHEKRKPG